MVDVRAEVVNELAVAPATGLAVTPEFPTYHWKVSEAPEAVTLKVVLAPLLMLTETGWLVMTGGKLTVAIAVVESADPAALLARTQ